MRMNKMTWMLLASTLTAVSMAVVPAAADWPQWRGPTRDGAADPGLKLLDAWPTNGPRQVWKSEPIPWGKKGGGGSPVVADGKVFLYVHSRAQPGKVMITTQDMHDFGWMEGVPDDLPKKIDEAFKSEKARALKPGPAWDAFIKEFEATLDPQWVAKFGPFIENRMKRMKEGRSTFDWFEWPSLKNLAVARDLPFATIEDLNGKSSGEVLAFPYGRLNGVRELLYDRTYVYSDTVICLDAATGKELWRKVFPGVRTCLATEWGASSTPAVWDGKCYVTGSAGFYCLKAKDGAVVWQTKTKFSNSSPLVMNGAVYAGVPEAMAYEASTGQALWSLTNLTMMNTSFTTWQHGGTNYLIAAIEGGTYSKPQGGAYCLDPKDGRELWRAWNNGNNSTPVIRGDLLVLRGFAYQMTLEKATPLWNKNCDGDGGSQIVFQDSVYHTGGHCYTPQLRCLDLKTSATKWDLPNGAWPREIRCSSPVLADGKIIAVANESEAILFRATPEKYDELGRFNPRVVACTSPAIAGGMLYLRLEDGVACYDLTAR